MRGGIQAGEWNLADPDHAGSFGEVSQYYPHSTGTRPHCPAGHGYSGAPLELFDTRQDFPAEQLDFLHHFPVVGAGLLEAQVHHAHAALVMQQFPPMAPMSYVTMMSEQSTGDLTSIWL